MVNHQKKGTVVFLIGKSGRVHALAQSICSNDPGIELVCLSEVRNPGLLRLSKGRVSLGNTESISKVKECALEYQPDIAVIGPEEPLAAGVANMLEEMGIPVVGPTKEVAMLESSKAFARRLLSTHGIQGNPEYRVFENTDGIKDYIESLGEFAVKPDGLSGGKGVKVSGDHLQGVNDGVRYARELFESGHKNVLIEEKLDGEEFSLQAFCDGETVVSMPPVQDHKRASNGDTGPNTGGMGSYSCADHSLPFLSPNDLAIAKQINRDVIKAIKKETGQAYKGILFGGFMLTAEGIRLIEYNVRFGDPEVCNILPILETSFLSICKSIIEGRLSELDVCFRRQATVCKYVVPTSYPSKSENPGSIQIDEDRLTQLGPNAHIYFGAVNEDEDNGNYDLTGSRAVACVGVGDSISEAENLAERTVKCIQGDLRHRSDIGTSKLIEKRVKHVKEIRLKATDSLTKERKGLKPSSTQPRGIRQNSEKQESFYSR